ncbi:DUF6456 domain-containing protein [Caulobacter henricii]|uniref:DUF6456 domain-containing protein n=1 Tax=Caulobacter henricii TaxID=69395 RepID=A0A0P0P1P8_9CAUL|nr:DUF6456 domain-containing protein [Caulobacter henricii]ALL14057.1 hypothetical protein AQ619_12280 [Caulobacter henricii]
MSGAPDLATEHLAHRAARLLARPGAVIEAAPLGYAVRLGPNRRRRPMLVIDEPAFEVLVRLASLKPRAQGGWTLVFAPLGRPAPPPGRPGIIEGEKLLEEPGVGRAAFRANLGESPLAWLARRRDGQGRPWLAPVEAAAGERLREDFHRAGTVGRLTMSWDATPRSAGRGPGLEPAERARAAKDRIAAALEAAGPGLREILEHVCLAGTALEAAERALGLPRRAGKTVLKLALQRLVSHYRMA